MNKISAGQYPNLYRLLRIDTSELGCIMLDVKPFELKVDAEMLENDLYFSPSSEFTQGVVVDHKAHVTLLYGLLEPGLRMQPFVDMVLETWKKPAKLKIESVGVFPGKEDDGTEYSCIVAHIDADDLEEANQRLRLLPHIDTFPKYQAHMTLAYVKASATTEWLEQLSYLEGSLVETTAINYGS